MSNSDTRDVRIILGALTRVEYTTVVRVPKNATQSQLDALVEQFYQDTDGTEFQDDAEFWDKGECRYELLAVDENVEPEFEASFDDDDDLVPTRLVDPPHEFAKLTLSPWTVGDVQTLFDVNDEKAEEFILNNQKHFQDRMTELSWDVLTSLGLMDGLPLSKEPE